jgi:hypothetical protein
LSAPAVRAARGGWRHGYRRAAALADRERVHGGGIWWTPDHVCQPCPCCHATVAIPEPAGFTDDDPADATRYSTVIEHGLDAAVFDHLRHDCPTPEATP